MNALNCETQTRLNSAKKSRFNPLSQLNNPGELTRKLDAFDAGYLKETVNIWDLLEQRDDLIRTVVSKRKKAVGRRGWTVLIHDSIPPERRVEAQAHAAALEFFYQNLRCEHALDRAERGGFKLLCRQMMDAIGKRFAVHEIVWRNLALPNPDPTSPLPPRQCELPNDRCLMSKAGVPSSSAAPSGEPSPLHALSSPPLPSSPLSAPSSPPRLTATFRFVPLSFFENTTGELRFLESDSAVEGAPLAPGSWMISVGEGLMAATSVAWIVKNTALNDWLLYSERNGRPILRATTASAADSEEWKNLENTLTDILNGSAVVHSSSDDVKVIDLAVGGNIPFPQLVERMDRMIAALWRGADLSTLSRDRGYGASLQEKETCALEEDDADMLTETFNEYVDPWVIRYLFGPEATPLANVKVLVTPEQCTTADIQIDEFLYRTGAPLALHELLTRYGRPLPKPGEEVVQSTPRSIQPEENPTIESAATPNTARPAPPSEPPSVPFSPPQAPRSGLLSLEPSALSLPSLLPAPRSEPLSPTPTSPLSAPSSPPLSSSAPSTSHFDLRNSHLARSPEPLSPAPSSPLQAPRSEPFSLLQRDWIQLSPYGDFPHARGLQRVDREAVDAMVRQFNSFRARLGRLFGGAPFYVGHPDTPQASELADAKAYGWIMQLEARDDGLYGRVKWSEAGLQLLQQAHYKYLSPYWDAKLIGRDGNRAIFRPTALISAGLTNTPNIPVNPLSNSTPAQQSDPCSRIPLGCVLPLASAVPESNPLASSPPPLPIPAESVTENLSSRRGERFALQNTRHRIRHAVQAKMRAGLTYEAAWREVKQEHQTWFTNQSSSLR